MNEIARAIYLIGAIMIMCTMYHVAYTTEYASERAVNLVSIVMALLWVVVLFEHFIR